MDNDTHEMLRSVGCVPTVLGIGVCTLGVIYALNELLLLGLVASASSAALVFAWDRDASLDPSWWVTI